MVQKLAHKPRPTKKSYVINKFIEFCKRTDLHGFKYIVMEDLNVVERLTWLPNLKQLDAIKKASLKRVFRCCWAVAVFVSMIIAIMFVITAYKWYARNPVVTVIESTQGAIWDIPFPAVTICEVNSISRRAAKSLSKNLTLPANMTSEYIFQVFKLVPLLLFASSATVAQKKSLVELQDVLDLNNISMETLYRELAPTSSCDNLIQRCMWKNIIYRCDQLFQHVITKLGICCSFNYYAFDSTTEKRPELIRLPTPRRVASCGYQTALTILLNVDVQDYYSTVAASHGVLVLIDNAYNIPDLDSPVRMVNPSTEVLIALSPERTYSTSGVKAFSPEQRQCYYQDEATVGKFEQYSFHNCMVYEKIRIIKRECDCIPLYYPLRDGYRTCNFRDLGCLHMLEDKLSQKDEDMSSAVQCLPECEHYDYPLEVALGQLSSNVQLNGLPFFENVNIENSSVLNIFFNDLVSTRYRRDVYLNWQNILAAFGGLLSLMLGFTLISGFDFVTFFTFRMIYDCTLGNFVGKRWESQEDKVINVVEKPKILESTEKRYESAC
ncbi:unnamed protein product [Leptosia nina]|uniref:Sodium channel protein Nach n=1 Tax=Leptosia nina TaxID=320188 RepID=A0AAV1K2K7_9NEOP